ncbi:DUF2487 family protein [Bacillus paranthracis]
MKMVVEQGEFIELLSMELEREYKRKSAFITCIYVSSRKSKKRKRSFARMDKSFGKSKVLSILLMLQVDFSWKEDMQELQEIYFGFLHNSVRTI